MADQFAEMIKTLSEPTDTSTAQAEAPKAATIQHRPGEQALVEWVDQLYTDAEKAQHEQGNESQWDDWLRGYWGEIWESDTPSFKPPIVVNLLKTRVQQEISDLTDSPTKVFVQKDRTKGDRDKNVEKFIQAFWVREFVDQQVMLAALDAMIYPCGFLGVTYDPTADFGRGKLLVRCRDPRTVFPDPDCTNDDDWAMVILKDPLDLTEIRARWVDQGMRVRPDNAYSLKSTALQGRRGSGGTSGKFSSPMYAGATSNAVDGYIKARAAVLSVFIKDDSVEIETIERSVQQINDLSGAKVLDASLVSKRTKKYPYGRLIQVANGIVLYDGPNPYMGRFPIVRVILQPTTHTFWPPASPLSDVLEIYRAANKMDSMVVENGLRLNGGMIVADANSGIDPARWTNNPGQVILKQPGSTIEVKYPSAMPSDMVSGGQRLRGYADEVLGFAPSRVGAGQRGNVSPELTETEITQAMGISRLRGRLLHQSVQRLVEIMFAGFARFYSTPRIVPHIKGDQWDPITWNPILNPEAFAVHVDPASFEVKSKTMIQRLMFTLAKLGKIPDDELLNALNVPNADEISKKNSEQLKLQAMAGLAKKGKKK